MPSLCNDLCEKKVISAILHQKKSLRIQFTAGRSMLSMRIEAELFVDTSRNKNTLVFSVLFICLCEEV